MARRGHNEGSIYKREDGRWAAMINLGYVDGKRKRQTFYGRTRKEVQEQLTTALSDVQRGLPLPSGRMTVGQYLESWLENIARLSVRQTTWESYERLLRVSVVPVIGRIPLKKLEPLDLDKLYRTIIKSGRSARTAQYAHAVVHRALSQAVRRNVLARNPADAVDPPRPKRVPIKPLDAEQIGVLLKAAKTDRLYALYVLALATGMRQGELLGLSWSEVDLHAGALHVRQQVGRTKEGVVFSEPKTAKGRRAITLPTLAVEALRDHRTAQLEERLAAGSRWIDMDLAFPNQNGKPIEKQNLVRRSFRPLLERAGLPAMRFHDLRHSAATLLLSQGIHPKVVQERLGHASISITMDVYSHVMPALQREAADKLDAFFEAV